MGWADRVESLLYTGETVTERVTCATATVVVTSHRLLAFTPEQAGENLRVVDRPNVEGVEQRSGGDRSLLLQSLKAGILGVVLVGLGAAIDLETLLPSLDTVSGTDIGMGGLLETVRTAFRLLGLLDDVLFGAGIVALAVSAAFTGWYVRTREETLVIVVAGDDDLVLPAPTDDGTVARLHTALWPGENSRSQTPDANTAPAGGDVVTFEDLTAEQESQQQDA